MVNIWEEKILQREKEVHHLVQKHKDRTKTPTPYTITGYIKEDIQLADWMTWLRNTHIILRKCVFHIENEGNTGGEKGAMQGAISLAKGKLKGVFDILSVYKGVMVWIELKLPGEDFSDSQKELHTLWSSWGVKIYRVRTFAEFKWVVEEVILKLV